MTVQPGCVNLVGNQNFLFSDAKSQNDVFAVSSRLIINDNIDKGSQLPYIKWARENGYALLVANTNINSVDMTVKGKKKKEPVKIRVRLHDNN